jgi:hypothetical protein
MPKEPNCLSWQPENMITDTPFQVLKMTGYANYRHGCFRPSGGKKEAQYDDGLRLVNELLLDVWIPLLSNLDETDVRGKYAWPHRQKDGVNIFRLDDHVWLWRTPGPTKRETAWMLHLDKRPKSAPEQEVQARPKATQRQEPTHVDLFKEVTRRLLPEKVKHAVLQCFNTLNEVSHTQMLAVTRSPRGSRFLLHSRDTALFYGDRWGFFSGQFKELWENTIQSQVCHNEYQENRWEKTLRFGLSAVAETRGCVFEPSADPVKHLVQSCGHNGFISGYLDASSQSPCLFSVQSDRDYFYQ